MLVFAFAGVVGRSVASAEEVSVPLRVPETYLSAVAAGELGLDETGRGELSADGCSRVELFDLVLDQESSTESEQVLLVVDIGMTAHAGARVFGRCRSPGSLTGRARLALLPTAGEDGRLVRYDAVSAEFRNADGSTSMLTKPSRALAESLLVPRLQQMRVDVSAPLLEIDLLIGQFLGETAGAGLDSNARLGAIVLEPGELRADLVFDVEAPAVPVDEAGGSPQEVLSSEEQAQWSRLEDELDGFLTVVIGHLAMQTENPDVRLALAATLLDARLRLADMLLLDEEGLPAAASYSESDQVSGSSDVVGTGNEANDAFNASDDEQADTMDPLRLLFLDSWKAISEAVAELPPAEDEGSVLRLASFLAAGDALALVDALGPRYGIEVSRDGLRRMARLLLAGEAPVSFTPLPLETDPAIQALFGFGAELERKQPPAKYWYHRLHPIPNAFAEEPSPAEQLREVFPDRGNLDAYLDIVARLIEESLDNHWADSRLNEEQRELFEPLVRATAWKETCWRHYLPEDEGVKVIRSAVGAVGMMQIVGRVWRSVFDLELLESEVDYNVGAGIDILEHYFLDYAVRRGEHLQPGGMDNLVRATYAAYNGGPSRLSRYRREGVAARAKAVDAQFYRHYQSMTTSTWPVESRCYAR
ncbi:MAG: lytic transglycosylase domain-containing protein [Pseudomonadota bacterium]